MKGLAASGLAISDFIFSNAESPLHCTGNLKGP